MGSWAAVVAVLSLGSSAPWAVSVFGIVPEAVCTETRATAEGIATRAWREAIVARYPDLAPKVRHVRVRVECIEWAPGQALASPWQRVRAPLTVPLMVPERSEGERMIDTRRAPEAGAKRLSIISELTIPAESQGGAGRREAGGRRYQVLGPARNRASVNRLNARGAGASFGARLRTIRGPRRFPRNDNASLREERNDD